MKKLLLALALLTFPSLGHAAGSSCTCGGKKVVGPTLYYTTCTGVADNGTGAIPDCTPSAMAGGGTLYGMWTVPTGTPTDDYDVTLVLNSGDLMGGGALNRDTANAEWANPLAGSLAAQPAFHATPTLKFANNSDTSCSVVVDIYWSAPR